MKISLIHPSRGRFKKSKDCTYTWRWLADDKNFELIVSIDKDDKDAEYYKDFYLGFTLVSENRSAVDAINNAAKVASGDILIVVSDDTVCCNGWDTAILKEVNGKTDWILKSQDGIQKYIITNPIMDRAYYNRLLTLQNGIYHPGFDHLFCDTFLTCQADILGRKITSNLMFKHDHYSVNGTKPDELHKRNDATWKQGEETFIRLMKQFTPEERKRITDPSMRNWLRNKGL